jgi:hypothetical protein
MTLIAQHSWNHDGQGGFQWTTMPEGMPVSLREALEPYCGYPWLGHDEPLPITWAMRAIEAGGLQWHVLSTGHATDALPDGRPLRHVRHVVLEHPLNSMLPGRHLALDAADTGDGDDTSMIHAGAKAAVNWTHCGGDWSRVFAERVKAGMNVRVILPATCAAMDWWLSIEQHLDATVWNRTILLEQLPDETGAHVVLAVDGTPCATAMRQSGRAVVDLATHPEAPPEDPITPTSKAKHIANPVQLPDVELAPGGLPVGLTALTAVALVLAAGVVAAILWALDTGSVQ